jgi:hypothetical protein
MKKLKTTVYVRYEFSNEAGHPEGGDILKFSSVKDVQDFTSEILAVANGDEVTVNLTVGTEKPFFGFLKAAGMNREDAEKEMVNQDEFALPSEKKTKKVSKKATKKPAAKKAVAKKAKK